MVNVRAVFRATGPQFSPELAERTAGVSFSRTDAHGAIAATGRYRGQPRPYGSGELDAPEANVDLIVPDQSFFEDAERLKPASAMAGADLLVLHMDVAFTEQCNFEFSPQFIAALARLGVPVTVSCFDDG